MMTSLIKPEKQASYLFLSGFALYKSGRLQEALEYFRMVTFLVPQEGRYWISLGHVQKRVGDLDGAMEAYKAALLLNQEKDSDLWLSLAECLKDKGETHHALAALDEAIAVAKPAQRKQLEFLKTRWSN